MGRTQMKKILIVNNNMNIGGIQKSLCNLLWAIHGQYQITLFLFSAQGAYRKEIPPDVQVISCTSRYRLLGMSQRECRGRTRLLRGCFAAMCRLWGRERLMPLIQRSQAMLTEDYDCAISYMHGGNPRHFYGGTNEFVLNNVRAVQKVAFLHGDFQKCGGNTPYNRQLYGQFDWIAACSEGCRRAFAAAVPALADRCIVVPNCHCYEKVRACAGDHPVQYSADSIHALVVARLAHEKGVERAIAAAVAAGKDGYAIELHIVGRGAKEQELKEQVQRTGGEAYVHFYGEQENPYRFMPGADFLWLTSYHEAAPMVIEEAACLGLPTLSTRTSSSKEMVEERGCGWVCDNTQEGIEKALRTLLQRPELLIQQREKMRAYRCDNTKAIKEITALLGT